MTEQSRYTVFLTGPHFQVQWSVLKWSTALFCLLVPLLGSSTAEAYSGGIGSNSFSATSGCNQCHGGGSFTPVVTVDGPASLNPGQKATYTVTVTGGGSQTQAGFNAAGTAGTLSVASDGNSTNTRTITGTASRTEITHSARRAMDSSPKAVFSFQVTAPTDFTQIVLTGWGNAINNANGNQGDKAAKGTLSIASTCADGDGDGFSSSGCGGTDCNDGDSSVNPVRQELCNGVDDDCDGLVDASDPGVTGLTTYYRDQDGDGVGSSINTTQACSVPSGFVTVSGDCDDNDANVNPSATEVCNTRDDNCNGQIDEGVKTNYYVDVDGDGFGKAGSTPTAACSAPGGSVANNTDCNDNDNSIFPGATEICDSIDNDCDAQIDEGIATFTWYRDADLDGYGTTSNTQSLCGKPSGYVAQAGDCDDTNSSINPDASEICNSKDDDCDGLTDDGDPSVIGQLSYCQDSDGDGFGNPSSTTLSCAATPPGGYVSSNVCTDCSDTNVAINPVAQEICDGKDNDCDTLIDDADGSVTGQIVYFSDLDSDGYGNSASSSKTCSSTPPSGMVAIGGDCNDTNPAQSPGQTETATQCEDTIDQDCNGQDLSCSVSDGDGDGFAPVDGDCDDDNLAVYPGAVDVCDDEIDQDCSGEDHSCDTDEDGQTVRDGDCDDLDPDVYIGALEVCGDGVDQDCSETDLSCLDVDGDRDGQTPRAGDCDDANPSAYVGALEVCGDGIDQDCSGTDLGCGSVDSDEDGQTPLEGDCDDSNPSVYTGASESCGDGIDQDCSGSDLSCSDVDGDGDGFTPAQGDCEDDDVLISPDADEVPYDGIDQDCQDGDLVDVDNDGFEGGPGGADCNDGNSSVYPEAPELEDGLDNDCNELIDDLPPTDADQDGVSVEDGDCNDEDSSIYPGALEVCGDGIDQDCSNGDTSCGDDDDDTPTPSPSPTPDADESPTPGDDEVGGSGCSCVLQGPDVPSSLGGSWALLALGLAGVRRARRRT